jgi:hypothetical protein
MNIRALPVVKGGPTLHSKQAEVPSDHVARREAFQVARYVTDMTAQLEAMAAAARLDLLVYFLSMAKVEGDLFVPDNAQADSSDNDIPSD